MVGDSFSFAPQMQYDDSFSKRLERLLNANATDSPKSPRAEVINLGVPGHSTVHEVRTVEEALKLSPDLVLLQITLNDAELRPFNMEPVEFQRKFGKCPCTTKARASATCVVAPSSPNDFTTSSQFKPTFSTTTISQAQSLERASNLPSIKLRLAFPRTPKRKRDRAWLR